MASVPGPDPDRPLPRPGAPAQEPPREDDERWGTPPEEDQPSWLPEPYDPQREREEQDLPAGVP